MPQKPFDPRTYDGPGGAVYTDLALGERAPLKSVRMVVQVAIREADLMETACRTRRLTQSEWVRRACRTYLIEKEGMDPAILDKMYSPEEIDTIRGRQISQESYGRLLKELGESVTDPKGLEALFNLKMMLLGTGTGSTMGGGA